MAMPLGQEPTVGEQVQQALGIPEEGYSMEQWEQDVAALQPRVFDTYVLPLFLIGYAMVSKRAMGRWPRRLLFLAGVYMTYRNWSTYKELTASLAQAFSQEADEIAQEQ